MVYCMDLPFFLEKKGRGRWLILACVFIEAVTETTSLVIILFVIILFHTFAVE